MKKSLWASDAYSESHTAYWEGFMLHSGWDLYCILGGIYAAFRVGFIVHTGRDLCYILGGIYATIPAYWEEFILNSGRIYSAHWEGFMLHTGRGLYCILGGIYAAYWEGFILLYAQTFSPLICSKRPNFTDSKENHRIFLPDI